MRHRIGIALACGMFAAVFFAGGWGYDRLLRLPVPAGHLPTGSVLGDHRALAAIGAVAATGLLAGLLIAVSRVSPLATGLPGLVLVGWTGLYLVSERQAVDMIPLRSDTFGAGFEAMLFNGTLAAAGLAMIVPMALPSRWRRRPAAAESQEHTWGPGQDTIPVPSVPPSVQMVPREAAVTRMQKVVTAASQPRSETAVDEQSPWVIAQRAATARPGEAGQE